MHIHYIWEIFQKMISKDDVCDFWVGYDSVNVDNILEPNVIIFSAVMSSSVYVDNKIYALILDKGLIQELHDAALIAGGQFV